MKISVHYCEDHFHSRQVILQGWPDQKEVLHSELHPYLIVRDELTARDGVLFKGLRCVIPLTLSLKIHEQLHGAHTGVKGCLQRARETVYWPGMNADLHDYIAKCGVCPTYQKDQQKEPLIGLCWKNCAQGLEYRTQDRGHSFFQYRQT